MQQQSEQKKMYDECVIPREMSDQLMKEAKETLEKPEIKNDGCFTFDYFMKSQALVNKYWHMYAMPLILSALRLEGLFIVRKISTPRSKLQL